MRRNLLVNARQVIFFAVTTRWPAFVTFGLSRPTLIARLLRTRSFSLTQTIGRAVIVPGRIERGWRLRHGRSGVLRGRD